jgi:hypothetical protein
VRMCVHVDVDVGAYVNKLRILPLSIFCASCLDQLSAKSQSRYLASSASLQ